MATMIRHHLSEGWLLLRRRSVVSLTLALGLAVPICLAGLTLTVTRWLQPLVRVGTEHSIVAVLLHPQMDASQTRRWLARVETDHREWKVEAVPAEALAERLEHWFPYLSDLLENEAEALLPILVEISTDDPESVGALLSSPSVIAVGPRTSVHRLARVAARRLGWLLATVTVVLLLSAALLAAIWVHLELYRHADEITIMRLIGATESAIRGPLLVAVTAPGLLAAILSGVGTTALASSLSKATAVLGLPPVTVAPALTVLQAAVAIALPMLAAALTLARHALSDMEG